MYAPLGRGTLFKLSNILMYGVSYRSFILIKLQEPCRGQEWSLADVWNSWQGPGLCVWGLHWAGVSVLSAWWMCRSHVFLCRKCHELVLRDQITSHQRYAIRQRKLWCCNEKAIHSTFEVVCRNIRKQHDAAFAAIDKESNQLLRSVQKLRSDALFTLSATKAAADGLKEFTEAKLEECRHELPMELFKTLKRLLYAWRYWIWAKQKH